MNCSSKHKKDATCLSFCCALPFLEDQNNILDKWSWMPVIDISSWYLYSLHVRLWFRSYCVLDYAHLRLFAGKSKLGKVFSGKFLIICFTIWSWQADTSIRNLVTTYTCLVCVIDSHKKKGNKMFVTSNGCCRTGQSLLCIHYEYQFS